MFLKLLRTAAVLKNEISTEMLLKRKYYSVFAERLGLDNCHSLQHRTKSDVRKYRDTKQYYPSKKNFSVSNNPSDVDFEQACNETLESLCEYLEQIVEDSPQLDNPDITFSDGVLTVQLGEPYGTYVINRQTPNKQIWLSSPKSGPKRYDFDGTKWIYKHDGVSLHELLTTELSEVFSAKVNFSKCVFSGANI